MEREQDTSTPTPQPRTEPTGRPPLYVDGTRMHHAPNPRLSQGTSPLAVLLWRNAYFANISIPIGEVLSTFRPHLMCPRALLVVTNFDGIARERSRFKNWTILFFAYVCEPFRKDRLSPHSDRNFSADDIQPNRQLCWNALLNASLRSFTHSLNPGRPHYPPMKLTRNKALSASSDFDPLIL